MRDDGVEFCDDEPGRRAADDDEVLDTDSRAGLLGRIPVWAWVVLAVAIVIGSVVVAVHQTRRSTNAAGARHTSAPIASMATSSVPADAGTPAPLATRPTRAVAAAAGPPSTRADTLAQLAYLADFAHPLQNNLLEEATTPACPQIPIGDDPTGRVAAALRAHLRAVVVRDSSVTMNADATLCGLNVRARGARDGSVVVEIVAPPRAAATGLRAQHRSGDRVLRAVTRTTHGWQITIAWAGPSADAPSMAALGAIARDRHLQW